MLVKLAATVLMVSSVMLSSTVSAKTPCIEPASADVWMIETGGLWNAGEKFGNFRVVLMRQGLEHSSDKIQVQIRRLDEPVKEILRCIDLSSPGAQGYVTKIRIHSINDSSAAIELSVVMKAMYEIILQDVFLVSINGTVKQIQKARYEDVSDFE